MEFILDVSLEFIFDVSSHVSLSDSVRRAVAGSVRGESCQLSSDGVRDSAGYGHRSILALAREIS